MRFRDLPIRRKLLLMTLASSGAAVVLATAGFLTWDVLEVRNGIRNDMLAQARIISESSGAALSFADDRVAGENLAVLQLRPHVVMACLYTAAGRIFATYYRDPGARCPPAPPEETHLASTQFDVVAPVTSGRDRVGTLYINRDLKDLYDRLQVGAGTLLGLLGLAIAAAFVIAARIQGSIAAPLLDLAETARTISSTRNYSLRAVPLSSDEVGVVVEAFNDMLEQIQARTAELSKANHELEHEVEERRRVETERTAALEREQTANRLKDEFLATLSHELRTPLNAVLGWTRILRSTRVEPGTEARALESIERNAQAQARLIEDLLEVSRIVTGKLRLQVRDTDFAAIVDAAVEVIQTAAAAKRIALDVEIAIRPAMTAGDPDRLQQVVWNLLSNAVKFTPPDGRVFVTLQQANGYRLTIRDTGPGIEPPFLPYVFEPFRQADGTPSREHGGLGLGLAIAKQLVELHGGTIVARSLGHGTGATFEVSLPSVVSGAARATARPKAAATIDPTLLRGIRVLVVDDEEDARLLMQAALGEYGADVTTAASVADAIASVDAQPPDILLSDIGMPHEDGYSLIRRLGSQATPGDAIPAIAVTAYASQQDRDRAIAAGFRAHVSKPFDPDTVVRLIAQFARRRNDLVATRRTE